MKRQILIGLSEMCVCVMLVDMCVVVVVVMVVCVCEVGWQEPII